MSVFLMLCLISVHAPQHEKHWQMKWTATISCHCSGRLVNVPWPQSACFVDSRLNISALHPLMATSFSTVRTPHSSIMCSCHTYHHLRIAQVTSKVQGFDLTSRLLWSKSSQGFWSEETTRTKSHCQFPQWAWGVVKETHNSVSCCVDYNS